MPSLSLLGQLMVLIALGCAGAGAVVAFFAGASKSLEGWRWARGFAYGFGISAIAANLLMIVALLVRDYSISYVAQVGSWKTTTPFAIASLWASLDGSILLWAGVLGGFTLALTWMYRRSHHEYMPWALGVLLSVCVFFGLLVSSIANPFHPTEVMQLASLCAGPRITDPAILESAWFTCSNGVVPVGRGPNAVLANHWLMTLHPPTLYLGYVGMAVPFAMCSAALLAGRLEAGWIGPLRRWFLVPWGFLSVGIVMGGWWSYAVLGWGGYWAWDPVENASFMPWLTGTAFLHSAMMMERRGALKTWSLVLGLGTFIMTMFGTFLTRSGVLNSVHAFADGPVGPTFLVFIVIVTVFSVFLLAIREHDVRDNDLGIPKMELEKLWDPPGPLISKALLGAVMLGPVTLGFLYAVGFLTDLPAAVVVLIGLALCGVPGVVWMLVPVVREFILRRGFAILLQNVVFCVFTFVVFLGTVYPMMADAVRGQKVSVGAPYFDWFALPLGIALVWLMGVGPLLPWARTTAWHGWRLFLPPLVGALLATGLAALIGIEGVYPLLAVFVCAFAVWANLSQLIEPVVLRMIRKREWPHVSFVKVVGRSHRRFGGHIAHYGVILAVLAIAATRSEALERDVVLERGTPVEFAGYYLVYEGFNLEQRGMAESTVATLQVQTADGSPITTLRPALNDYPTQMDALPAPDIHTTFFDDLFVSLMGAEPDKATFKVKWMPFMIWLWIAAGVVGLGTLIAVIPGRGMRRQRKAGAASSEEEAA